MDVNMMRMQMQQHLDGMNYPASKDDVMAYAMQHGANSDEMEMLKKMPMDAFNSFDDVSAAAGRMTKMS
jgi:hypothetical protein